MAGHLIPGKIDGTWYIRVELPKGEHGKRRQKRETFRGTKRDAERRLRYLLNEVDTGTVVDGRMTMGELFGRWLRSREAKGRANKTLASYRQHDRDYLTPTFGHLRVSQLRAPQIEDALISWRTSEKKGRGGKGKGAISARTVRHLYDSLRASLVWAEKSGILTPNPIVRVEPPTYKKPRVVTLDVAGFVRLLDVARGAPHPLLAPILTAVGTGLRRGELLGIRWSDVDLDVGFVSVLRSIEVLNHKRQEKAPKTEESQRTIALVPFVVDVLRIHHKEQKERRLAHGLGRDEDAYVFDTVGAQPWHPDTFSWWVNTLCDQAGVPHVTLQALRRSFGTLLLEAGAELHTVSRALGHTNTATTERSYLGAVRRLSHADAGKLQALLGGAVAGATFVPLKAAGDEKTAP